MNIKPSNFSRNTASPFPQAKSATQPTKPPKPSPEKLFAKGEQLIVVKSQIHAGGRGKGTFKSGFQGGVKLCKTADDVFIKGESHARPGARHRNRLGPKAASSANCSSPPHPRSKRNFTSPCCSTAPPPARS